jgi:hypothetical protein
MTETTLKALERIYISPRQESVVNWFVAQALEKLKLVRVVSRSVILPPYPGPAKRLVTLTRAGRAFCKNRHRTSHAVAAPRKAANEYAQAIPPAFLLGISNLDR